VAWIKVKKMKKNKNIVKKQSIKEIEEDTQESPLKDEPLKKEIGGRKGLEPTRYGDWEKNGRCVDF